jgi:hypothetical protein
MPVARVRVGQDAFPTSTAAPTSPVRKATPTVTAFFAASRDWPFALPVWVLGLAASLTVLVGAIAGA